MYDNNEVDIIMCSDILSAQIKKGPHAAELQKIPYGGSYFFYFKTTRKPMEDQNVRKAFQMSLDMGKIVQAVFQGSQDPAYGIISPNLEGYTNPKSYYDPDGAKKALAASTYKTADALPPLTVRVGTNLPEYIRVAEAAQQMWKDTLGVNVTISQYDPTATADNGSAQIFRASLGTLVNDTSAAVSAMGLSSNSSMKVNVEAKNDEIDALLSKADSLPLTQQADRVTAYQQAEKLIMDQAYYVPIIWVQYYFAVKPWIKNMFSNTDLSLYNIPQMAIGKH
jgi:ABC-type oligopeptide transport system substrate-binding subunit